jgi:DNA (cytosine-5)-methyltransferase 1
MVRLLDLFCGAGGAAMGYHQAGFDEIVGVDLNPQPRYPFEFVQADALEYVAEHGHEFDAIHASPPCQDYSRAVRHLSRPGYPRFLEPTQEILESLNCSYVIENVVGSPIPMQSTLFGHHGVYLCGTMFGLRIWRHRLFATNFEVALPGPCVHTSPAMNPYNPRGLQRLDDERGNTERETYWREHWGVGWMKRDEGREAIPPAYTEYIGYALMKQIGGNI